MGSKNMFEFHDGNIKTGRFWTRERAEEIVNAWQRKFVEVIQNKYYYMTSMTLFVVLETPLPLSKSSLLGYRFKRKVDKLKVSFHTFPSNHNAFYE